MSNISLIKLELLSSEEKEKFAITGFFAIEKILRQILESKTNWIWGINLGSESFFLKFKYFSDEHIAFSFVSAEQFVLLKQYNYIDSGCLYSFHNQTKIMILPQSIPFFSHGGEVHFQFPDVVYRIQRRAVYRIPLSQNVYILFPSRMEQAYKLFDLSETGCSFFVNKEHVKFKLGDFFDSVILKLDGQEIFVSLTVKSVLDGGWLANDRVGFSLSCKNKHDENLLHKFLSQMYSDFLRNRKLIN